MKKDLISLYIFPLLNHVLAIACSISLVCLLKSQYLRFLPIFLFLILLSSSNGSCVSFFFFFCCCYRQFYLIPLLFFIYYLNLWVAFSHIPQYWRVLFLFFSFFFLYHIVSRAWGLEHRYHYFWLEGFALGLHDSTTPSYILFVLLGKAAAFKRAIHFSLSCVVSIFDIPGRHVSDMQLFEAAPFYSIKVVFLCVIHSDIMTYCLISN